MVRLTRHGWREMLIGSVVLVATGLVLGYGLSWVFSLVCVPVLIWLFAFFRDPQRPIPPAEQHVMVSPADGKVSDITEIEHDELLGGPAVRVGIFLSVFNVHVNRSPCVGRVLAVTYKKGKFINAMNHGAASDENESNTIVLTEPHSARPVAVVKQIVGLIARRIVCTVRVGDAVGRGERIGMIKFGSRTELTIPKWLRPQVRVAIGDKVKGASTVIAMLGEAIHVQPPPADHKEYEPLVGRESPA
ncbi:MAG: phosphatidylserine decarboxylase [Phycisphaerales bacterium]|nr:phosphatidylserine decarboxylase [Phycisphaerales bacterium]